MTALLINGALGKMGRMLADCAAQQGLSVAAGVDVCAEGATAAFPLHARLSDCTEAADVLVDFSRPAALSDVLDFARERKMPLVLATTGYSKEQEQQIEDAAKLLPVFRSANFSLGVNVLVSLAEQATAALQGFDVEIVEKHHKYKVDAPSGTALMLCAAVENALPQKGERVFGRSGVCPRKENEIGLHAVRGGSLAGEHELYFLGEDETVTLSHSAASRRVFALGALRAANFIAAQKPGLYDMRSMLQKKEPPTRLEEGWSLLKVPMDRQDELLSNVQVQHMQLLPDGGIALAVPAEKVSGLPLKGGVEVQSGLVLLTTQQPTKLPAALAKCGAQPCFLSVACGKASLLLKTEEAQTLVQALETA